MKQSYEHRKAQYHANKGNVGSSKIKIWTSGISSPRHRKGYRAKRGVFCVRVLQSLAGRNWRAKEVA